MILHIDFKRFTDQQLDEIFDVAFRLRELIGNESAALDDTLAAIERRTMAELGRRVRNSAYANGSLDFDAIIRADALDAAAASPDG